MSYLIKHNYIKWNYDALMLVNILLKMYSLESKQETRTRSGEIFVRIYLF